MKTQFVVTSVAMILLSVLWCGAAWADELDGVSDITVTGGELISFRYGGTEYAAANEDVILGTTTRWYIPATGVETLWPEGDPAPADTVTGTSNAKSGDVGSKGDNFLFTDNGATDISSIDGIDFQETIFPVPTKMIFVFERNGNDNGTVQGIFEDGSLGTALQLVANGAPYADTGVNVNGQVAHGYVFISDKPVVGLRITASGHDTLTICAVPMPFDPTQSHDPQPASEATDVLRDVVLSWTPGEFAATHDVYLGTSLDDVNNATRANPLDVLVSQGQTGTTYDAGRLEFGQTYYWRVDEVNAAPDNTIFAGPVWSFTVELLAYPIENITATASHAEATAGPENTINGSGLDDQDQHSIDAPDMWLAAPAAGESVWIQYEFDGVYKLHEMQVWNYNVGFELVLGFGLKDVSIEYSTDGSDWTTLGDIEFAQATATSTYTANTVVDFAGVAAQFVRLNVNSGHGLMGQFGLSEVRFLSIPVLASSPEPAVGAEGVEPDAVLSWRAGREAASHDVYLSDDETAVADGTALVDTLGESSYDTGAADLQLDTTYYWRIDEVNEAEAVASWAGPVWSFSTKPYQVVEDFESYNDDDNTIYDTWIDGWVNETGSTVGYLEAPFAEQIIVYGGRQSMPLFYDNTSVANSEAERTFDASQDWTRSGIATLVINFQGREDNAGGQLYAKVNGVKVVFDGDASAMTTAAWTAWAIDLTAVGTNLSNVTKLAIGIDGGGTGTLYVDEIRLLPAGPPVSAVLTALPAGSVEATGDDGMVLSINGIDVSNLVLGTTSTDFEKFADHPAADADDFDMGTYASLDDSGAVTIAFPVPVTTIFIVERGANDQGFLQPLDVDGNPMEGVAPFARSNWLKPGFTINGQSAGAMAIESDTPISGVVILPPTDGAIGIDPAVVAGIAAD
ncbi:MAG: discoidin domain-containing protein [Phycisphaerales bacterium]|nr:MAG: discoidin domain-containing protein [Phycisphaerales bacterium]